MSVPKFKPTKWKLDYCMDCKTPVAFVYGCRRSNHNVVPKPNVPFFVPDMRIVGMWTKGWAKLESDTLGQHFYISPSHLETIILETGILPKGRLPDNWWMYAKVGSSLTLKILPKPDNDEQKQ